MRPRVIVTRAADQAGPLLRALDRRGLEPVLVPAIEVRLEPAGGHLDAAVDCLDRYAWAVVTSANGSRAAVAALARNGRGSEGPTRWAAVGGVTAEVLEQAGIRVAFRPPVPTSASIGDRLPIGPGPRILVIRGDLAGPAVADRLRARGAVVDDVIGYRTQEAPAASGPLLRSAFATGRPDAIVLTSGSTARGLVALAAADGLDLTGVPVVVLGPETERDARVAGFDVTAVSPSPQPDVLAATAASVVAAAPNPILVESR